MNDPILDELHRQRRELAESFHNDLKAWLNDLRERAKCSREPHRSTPLKKLAPRSDAVATSTPE